MSYPESKHILGIDLGGTKIAAGLVDPAGVVSDVQVQPVQTESGPKGLVDQLLSIAEPFVAKGIQGIGIASAGPLDIRGGALLEATNLKTDGKGWGTVPLLAPFQEKFPRLTCTLENDAAAAALAEKWVGEGKDCENIVMATLGTGLGTAAICNGNLIRGGQELHTEGGHVTIRSGDQSALCGCGNYGCAEAFLAATNFATRFNAKNGTSLTAKEIAELRSPEANKAFEEYAELLAYFVYSFTVLFFPEKVVFAGSFAKASERYLAMANTKLEDLMIRRRKGIDLMPRLCLSSLNNHAGIVGAAYSLFSKI